MYVKGIIIYFIQGSKIFIQGSKNGFCGVKVIKISSKFFFYIFIFFQLLRHSEIVLGAYLIINPF